MSALHDTPFAWVQLHDWVWFLAFVFNAAAVVGSFVRRAAAENMLAAARSFHFGCHRVEWCGDHPETGEPRFCVKHAWLPSYRYRRDGSQEWEPLPSGRDEAFLERTNFSRGVAVALAVRLNEENDMQAMKEARE